jgi:hypothetical protein
MMDLDSFCIDQQVTVYDNTWRVKNKFKKYHFPWITEDSILLECMKDGTTTKLVEVIEYENFNI